MMLHTPTFRGSYVNIWEPRESKDGKKKIYEVTAIIPPVKIMREEDRKRLAELIAAVQALKAEKWPKGCPGFTSPFRIAGDVDPKAFGLPKELIGKPYDDDMLQRNSAYIGNLIIPLRSYDRPVGVVQYPELSPLTEKTALYSGCYLMATVQPFAYSNEQKGVTFGLRSLMKVRDGDPLVSVVDPQADFREIKVIDNSEMFANDLAGM